MYVDIIWSWLDQKNRKYKRKYSLTYKVQLLYVNVKDLPFFSFKKEKENIRKRKYIEDKTRTKVVHKNVSQGFKILLLRGIFEKILF